jgi:hypothetical protein
MLTNVNAMAEFSRSGGSATPGDGVEAVTDLVIDRGRPLFGFEQTVPARPGNDSADSCAIQNSFALSL